MKTNKKKLARQLTGLESNMFTAPAWEDRKQKIAERVLQKQRPKQGVDKEENGKKTV